jgi:hypothetical protein
MIFSMILIRSNINRSEESKKGAIKDDDFFYRENPISKKNIHLASNSPKNTTINLLDQTPEWNTTSIKDYYNHTWRIDSGKPDPPIGIGGIVFQVILGKILERMNVILGLGVRFCDNGSPIAITLLLLSICAACI